jgi:5-formyltetrahydrofolate cyclo-ligase
MAFLLQDEKRRVRRELKEVSAGFSTHYVAKASRAVCEKVLQSNEFREAAVVFGYLSFRNEISVDAVLNEALRLGKTVAVPLIVSKTGMKAALLETLDGLALDHYGIRTVTEPVRIVSPDSIDLVLVPGAGFTETGCRMGRGAGYYDRFLAQTHGFRLGITCDALLREEIPMDAYDQSVQALVTETRFIYCYDSNR